MSRSAQQEPPNRNTGSADRSPSQTAAIFDLLGDEIARSILATLYNGPKTARELVADCKGSRPTVYRRLSRLEEQELVRSEVQIDTDGHHRKEFSTSVESVVFELSERNFEAAIRDSSDATGD